MILALMPMQAQVRQHGKVTLQNSGHQPLPDVQIRALGAIPATSDAAGNFDLHFSKARPGQMLLIEDIYKEGYELVNEVALKQWTVSPSRQLPVVMCRKGTLAAVQEKYYEIGKSHNMARYAEACKQLDEQLEQNAITAAQYNARLDELSNAYFKTMEQLESYAYALACYNRDDLDKMSIEALALVEQGKIDEALDRYKNANLDKLLRGLDFWQEQERKEMEAMIPSLKLNADICNFAGGIENIQKARDIYEAIALSDTTNATYASEFASFLSENTAELEEARQWLEIAARHTTDSLLLAELYSGICMLDTYIHNGINDNTSSYIQKAFTIYKELDAQEAYNEDAYFNMSYTAFAITELKYWMALNNIENALFSMLERVDHANKALELQPEKYAYPYLLYMIELGGIGHEFSLELELRTDENLQLITDLFKAAINLSKIVDKKLKIKTAQWVASGYQALAAAYSNWGYTKKSDLYADSCQMIIENNMELNPVLFLKLKAENMLFQGQNLLMNGNIDAATEVLTNAYQIAINAPYANNLALQILNTLSNAMSIYPQLHNMKQD